MMPRRAIASLCQPERPTHQPGDLPLPVSGECGTQVGRVDAPLWEGEGSSVAVVAGQERGSVGGR